MKKKALHQENQYQFWDNKIDIEAILMENIHWILVKLYEAKGEVHSQHAQSTMHFLTSLIDIKSMALMYSQHKDIQLFAFSYL